MDPPSSDSYPFPPSPNYDWNRGLLLSKEIFNQQGEKLHRTINVYQNYAPGTNHLTKFPYYVYGLKIEELSLGRQGSPGVGGITYRASKYNMITDIAKVVSSKIDSVYFPGTGLANVVHRTDYSYSSKYHSFPTRISTIGSSETVTTEYFYPHDLLAGSHPDAAIFVEMINRNMISHPISVRKKINEVPTFETYNKYAAFGNLILKQAVYEKKGSGINISSTVDRKVVFNNYTMFGNLLQYTPENGIPTAIFWGYNNLYPVLKVEGATYDIVFNNLSQTLRGQIHNGIINANSFSNLRLALPNTMITNYTYKRLIGVTSITDPKGLYNSYIYDNFGRLWRVLDSQLNVLSENEYHYRTQD